MIQRTTRLGERELVQKLAASFLRSPSQRNALYQSDAELIDLATTDHTLAVTTDSLTEEIESGLYSDPYLIGWMTVMANASDLAAVGARPLGLLVNETLPKEASDIFIESLQRGINEASRAIGIPILGGDTNRGATLRMSATAIGTVTGLALLTRVGCRPGEFLYASGKLGLGNCFAASVFGYSETDVPFKPLARIEEGQLLLRFASCCMDTSDGFLNTLDELKILNGCGFSITASPTSYLSSQVYQIPPTAVKPWMMLAGPHGEYELVFTIPRSNHEEFLTAASEISWNPLLIGEACEDPDIVLQLDDNSVTLDTSQIRNFVYDSSASVSAFVKTLWQIEERIHSSHRGITKC